MTLCRVIFLGLTNKKRYVGDELWKTRQTLLFVIVKSRDLFFTWGASGGIIHRTHDTINLKATMFWIFPLGDVDEVCYQPTCSVRRFSNCHVLFLIELISIDLNISNHIPLILTIL